MLASYTKILLIRQIEFLDCTPFRDGDCCLLFGDGQKNRRGAVDLLGETSGRVRHHRNQVLLDRLSVWISFDDNKTGRYFFLDRSLTLQRVHRDTLG